MIIAGLAVSCGGIFMLQALATGFVPSAATHAKSAAVGLYTSAYYFGGSVGAIAPSLVWQRFGWPGCVGFLVGRASRAAPRGETTLGSGSSAGVDSALDFCEQFGRDTLQHK